MKKKFKKILASLLVAVIVLTAAPLSGFAGLDLSTTFLTKSNAANYQISVGDVIELGSYNGEPIYWICVGFDDNGPLMFCKDILCLKEFDAAGYSDKHNSSIWDVRIDHGSNCWSDSNIRQWLNTEGKVDYTHCPPSYADEDGFLSCFTASELSLVKHVTRKDYVNSLEYDRGYVDGGSKEFADVSSISQWDRDNSNYWYQLVSDSFFLLGAQEIVVAYKSNPDYLKASKAYFTSQAHNRGYSHDCLYWINADGSLGGASGGTIPIHKYGIRPAFYLDVNAVTNPDTPDDFTESIKFGADRFTFGQDMTGVAGDTFDALLVYASKENDINDLTITSSDPAVATVGTPKIDKGDYITQENERCALLPITLKSAGTATITVTSPTGVSESIVINVSKNGNSNKYSTYTGILESTVWSVADPENWVSAITVDGVKYPVEKNLISIESGNSAENKEVVCVVENGLVVWFDTIENIKVGINVGLSFPASQLTYYEGKFSEENLTLKVGISSTCLTDFPGDLSVLNDVLDANLLLDKITLTASDPISFNGSKTYTIDASSTKVYFGKTTIVATLNVELDKKYMETSQEIVYTGVSCDVTGIQRGIKFKDSISTSLIITKLENSKPTSNQNSASVVNTAAQKLEAIAGTSAATINGDITGTLNKLFTSEEREMIALTLLSEAALLCIPEEKLDLSSKVFEKVMGIKSSWFGAVRNKEIATTFISKTDAYGEIEVKFICNLSNFVVNNTKCAFYGTINYEIVGGKGRKNLTDDMALSGLAGGLSGADVTAFTNAIYEVADDMIKSSYEFGDSANDAAEIIFGKTVDEILRQTKYAKHLSKVKKIIVACKEIIIKCPVNVYVYDSANQLVAAVENNKVVLTNENAEILVNGDVKTVWLYDDTYRIEYQSLAEYDMSVTINEYGYSDCLLRTVEINDIPLKIGTNFTQVIDETILEEADYVLLSNDNQSYSADSDVCHLHNHTTTMKWELIQEATHTQYGIKVAICDLCNDWYKEIIPIVKGKVHSVSINDISMSYKDSATVTPSINADSGVKYTVSYSSSDTDVVSVDSNGRLTTNGTGSATITVTVTDEYGNAVTDTCKVEVSYKWWQWIIVIVLFGWIWY